MRRTAPLIVPIMILSAPATAQSIDPDNKHTWGENIGFLNFADAGDPDGTEAVFAETDHLSGYVWGENIGWINLDDDTVFAAFEACPADLTGDGVLDFFDVSAFLAAYSAMDPAADFTGDGVYNFFDVSAFLNTYSAGCP